MSRSTEALNPVVEEINSLPPEIGETLGNILNKKQNRIIGAPREEASRLTRLALAYTDIDREEDFWHRLTKRFSGQERNDQKSSIIAIDCEDLLKQENDLMPARLLLKIEEQFSATAQQNNPKIKSREGENPETMLLNYLTELKKVTGVNKQTMIIQNFDSLSQEQQIHLSEYILVHLTDNPTLNSIIFHEDPISLGVDSQEGYALEEAIVSPAPFFAERYPRRTEKLGKIIGDYQLDADRHQHLNRERFNHNSTIYPATRLSTQQRVMIKFDTSPGTLEPQSFGQNTRREYEFLANMHHPNIPRAYGTIDAPIFNLDKQKYSGLIMQLIDGSSLDEIMDFCKESRTSPNLPHIFDKLEGVADALHYAHIHHNIAYEDVKPGNILIETATQSPFLIDWETAVPIGKKPSTIKGSLTYFCPEKVDVYSNERFGINDKKTKYLPSPAGDVFSLGVVCYQLITGNLPFSEANKDPKDTDIFAMLDQIKAGPFTSLSTIPHLKDQMSRDAMQKLDGIFARALDKNPKTRLRDPRQLISSIQQIISESNIHILNYAPTK